MPGRFIRVIAILLGAAITAQAVPEQHELEQLVQTYLNAYVRQDLSVVRAYTPTKPADLFGAYPFTGPVTLSRPKVEKNQALVDFTGQPTETSLPAHGGMLFYRDVHDHNLWKFRQLLFYDHFPRIFNLPTRSVSDTDRGYEPAVDALAHQLMHAWEHGDVATLMAHWHNWPARNSEPIRGLNSQDCHVILHACPHQEQYARYTARLTYQWGMLSFTMTLNGGFFLVNTDEGWKVRGNVMAFFF